MMAFKTYVLYPLIAASIIPVGGFVGIALFYITGARVTADSLREAGLFGLGAFALMFFIFLFWQMHALRGIKKKTGLSLKEIGKLPVEEQKRVLKEYSGR